MADTITTIITSGLRAERTTMIERLRPIREAVDQERTKEAILRRIDTLVAMLRDEALAEQTP